MSGTATANPTDQESRAVRCALDSMDVIEDALELMPIGQALRTLASCRGRLDSVEARLLAARLEGGSSGSQVERLLQGDGKITKNEATKRTRRAKAVNENPQLGTALATGTLSTDQTDVIASASDKTNGDAARNQELIDNVAATTPDQAKRIANEFVRKHTSPTKTQTQYDKARLLRGVRRWSTDDGTDVLAIEGDTSSIDEMERRIKHLADQMYQADGGRDVPAGQHRRTRDQRNFDAAKQLITNGGPGASESDPAPSTPRATVVMTMTVDQATGADDTPVTNVGGEVVAPTVLDRLMCNAGIVGEVYNQIGEVLWQGRAFRFFTEAQVLAMIARDGECVLCGAHYSICEAHHLIPWTAWVRGPTDIDNGALVCPDCHHRIHDTNQTLHRDPRSGTWKLRPATASEAVRPRPETDSGNRSTKPRIDQRKRRASLF